MRQDKKHIRRVILSKLFDYLEQQFAVTWSRESFLSGQLTDHQIDAALAFKSDPYLDELRHALERLEDGTYGGCISCKRPISQDTLELNPAQRVCDACESMIIHTQVHELAPGVLH